MDQINFFNWYKLLLIGTTIHVIHGDSESAAFPLKQYNQMNQSEENPNNLTEIQNNLAFIMRIQFILNPEKTVKFLREEIYMNHEKYNITTEDLIDLLKLREHEMKDLAKMLGIPDVLLNFNTFRFVLSVANLSFSDYFNEIKKDVMTNQVQEAFKMLNIDPGELASAMAFGTEEQIYEGLNKGVYTWNRFDEVLNQTGWDIPTKTKDLILDQLINRSISSVAMDLQKMPFMNKNRYENFWDKMNLTTSDIYRVINIRRIVDNIYENITENKIIGVAVSEHEIEIHKKSIQNVHKYMDIISLYAESSETHQVHDNLIFMEGSIKNTSKLWTNTTISDIVGIIDKIENTTFSDCSYIDTNLVENNVTSINVTQSRTIITVNNDVIFNIGNPVLCNGKLLGLVVDSIANENVFVVDTFLKNADSRDVENGCDAISQFNFLYVCLLALLITKCQF